MTLRHPINYLKFAVCTFPQSISSGQGKATLTATTLPQFGTWKWGRQHSAATKRGAGIQAGG